MSNDDLIVELLIELVQKVDHISMNVARLNEQVAQLSVNQIGTNERLDRLDRSQTKTNVISQDHTLAIVKLADKIEEFSDVGKRLSRLEEAVFHL
jgi:hypothetical protein